MLYYFECRICGYDSEEAKKLSSRGGPASCPLCAGDCGHDNALSFREATQAEIDKLSPREPA